MLQGPFVRRLAAVCLVLVAAAMQQTVPAQTPAQAPTFRAGVSLATIDFLALTADGKPVTDLKLDEVSLRIEGKPRKLSSLQLVQVAEAPTAAGGAVPLVPPPPPFGSNAIHEAGRSIILVLDQDTLLPGKETPLKDSVNRFLNTLSSRDRVSFVTVPYGGVKTDLTSDHERVRKAVNDITGQAARDETGSQAACRSRLSLQALAGMLDSLQGGEGPTIVVFFSTSMVGPRRDNVMSLAPGMCELTPETFQHVGVAAARARALFYIIQPDDVIRAGGGNVSTGSLTASESIAGGGFIGSDNPRAGLEHLAGVTGGQVMHLTTSTEGAMTRVARETAGYYLLAFEPEPSDRNGLAHGKDLKVSRNGVVLRDRPQILLAKADPRAPATPAGAPAVTANDMLRQATVFRDLPLRAAAYVARIKGDDTQVKVMALAEPADPSTPLASMVAGLFDSTGKLHNSWSGDAAEFGKPPVLAALLVPPGVYRLRVAATDTTGRGGTADYEIDAQLVQVGPLRISAVVLGLSREKEFKPRLQFTNEPVAIAYLEIYGRPPGSGAQIGIVFELARAVNGQPLVSMPAALEGSTEPDKFLATAAMPIGGLPAGDFVVRAFVALEGAPVGMVVRSFRKAVQ